MKKLTASLLTAAFALSTNVLAVTVGDTVNYERNKDRTSKIIRTARGSLSVVNAPAGQSCNGTVIKLDYELDVLLKGKQKGNIGVCVPNSLVGTNFYADLASAGTKSFGAFDLQHKGFDSATDANGRTYNRCDVVSAINVDHNFQPEMGNTNQAKVMWIDHQGDIKYVTNMKISFKAAPGVKVLGAVEVDVSGVSNNGVSFKAGMDMK